MEGNYNMDQNPDALLERMQLIFKNREDEYRKRSETFDRRQATLDALSAQLLSDKERQEHEKTELEERETRLKEKEEQLKQLQEQYEYQHSKQKEEELQFQKRMEEEEERLKKRESALVQEHHLEIEEVRTTKMQLERERDEVKRESDLLKLGGRSAVDIDQYISRDEVRLSYLPVSEVQEKYIEREKHAEQLAELKKQLDAAITEKAGLVAQMLNQKEPEKQVQEPANNAEPESAGVPDESPEQTEAQEDLTAEAVLSYLEKNRHGLGAVNICHAQSGDQIEARKGRISCRIVFEEPPYFDISAERKEDRNLKRILKGFQKSTEFSGVKFEYRNGKVWATGYFTHDTPVYKLIDTIEKISNECFEE